MENKERNLKPTTLYLDSKQIQKLKDKGVNVSKTVRNYLDSLEVNIKPRKK